MKKSTLFLFFINFGLITQVHSMTLIPVSSKDSFSHSIRNKEDKLSNTFLSNEEVKFQFNISIENNAVGQEGTLYLVAQHNDNWYQYTSLGQWQSWDKQETSLENYQKKQLEQKETITVVDNQTLPAGEYLVHAGYQTEHGKQLFYNASAATMVVFDNNIPSLHQVKNKLFLADFFARGSINRISSSAADFSPALEPASPALAADSAGGSVSQTNIQESGVDEADRIKTDGEQLYTLENCNSDQNKQCLTAYTIQNNPANNVELSQLDIDTHANLSASLYLSPVNDKKHLIVLNGGTNFNVFNSWYSPYQWQNNKINIRFVDISQPESMQSKLRVSMDTGLISSRLIDGVLYLVTRKNPYFESSQPTPVDSTQPSPVFNPTVPENQDINNLLPVISFDDNEGVPVISATDCFIPRQNSLKYVDNTVITVTAIPLDNPDQHYSTCIAGNIDTFYMSTQSIYLTSSRYPVSISGQSILYDPGNNEMETEIHKFTLGKGKLEYRGSGTVEGHLGWDFDKQPFRMGEHDDVLKVATSKGNVWDATSTSSVSVLREAANSQRLETISTLDNLGKPGEKIYAARFIGARGYLVTFKKVDPLYVLDFTLPEQPKILGELEINGFSEYLHPIGENYLLGIGKDAIPEEGQDFSWYQGVKLSLFDVSDGDNLREVDSLVLGKRGTHSAVLNDHHALAWLASGDSATLAIPLQLNDRKPNDNFQDISHPNAFYNWSHTGLYTFNINTGTNPGIELEGKLITDTPPEICNLSGNHCSFMGQQTNNDRAVIQGDSVHYIHNNAVYSSGLADLN